MIQVDSMAEIADSVRKARKEQELAEKLERLQQLNAILNMDEKESVLMDGDAAEKDECAPPCKKGEAR